MSERTPIPSNPREVLPLVYDELDRLARRMHRRHRAYSVRPSSILQEAWAKMAQAEGPWADRRAFLALAASAMRQVLVDRARRRGAQKRGGDLQQVTLEDIGLEGAVDIVDVARALDELEAASPRAARLVELHVFAGMTHAEVGDVLGVSERTAKREWRVARAWLGARLQPGGPTD